MSVVTYYFNAYDVGVEEWTNNPDRMVDNNTGLYASTSTDTQVQLLTGNTCPGTDLGTISKVEIRAYGIVDHPTSKVNFRPVFGGASDGNLHVSSIHSSNAWSNYIDITADYNAPAAWAWSDVPNLDCDVIYDQFTTGGSVSKVEIRVTYFAGATEILYYFDAYDAGVEEWTTNPARMVDNVLTNYAQTNTEGQVQLLTGNTCAGTDLGTINQVQIRAYGYVGSMPADSSFKPVFGGAADGDDHLSSFWVAPAWGDYADITADTNAPGAWDWDDVKNLDCDIKSTLGLTTLASKVEIRVVYVAGAPPPVPDTPIPHGIGKESLIHLDKDVVFRETFNSYNDIAKNSGVVSGSPTIDGGVMSFVTANTDKVVYPSSKFTFSNRTAFTIHTRVTVVDDKSFSLEQANIPSYRVVLLKHQDNNLYFVVANGSNSFGSVALAAGTYDVIGVYDGSGANDAAKLKIYINGTNQTLSFSTAIPATAPSLIAKDFIIGVYNGVYYNTSDMDLVDIYDRALSGDEAKALYANRLYTEPSRDGLVLDVDPRLGVIVDRFGNAITNTAVGIKRDGSVYSGEYDGSTSLLNIDSVLSNSLANTTTGTWTTWVRAAVPAGTENIIAFGDTDAATYIRLMVRNTGKIIGESIPSAWELTTDNSVVTKSGYIHVGLVQDGTEPVLYINGVAVAQTFDVSTDKTIWFNNLGGLDNGRIGSLDYNSGGDIQFATMKDGRTKMYTRALTSEEVARDYQSSKRYYGG